MTFSIWVLALVMFLSGGVAGIFGVLVISIRAADKGHRLTDKPDTYLDALTRSVLGVGVRSGFAADESGTEEE